MREVVWIAGWDMLIWAIPCLGILLWSFYRLDRLISAIRDEEAAAGTVCERPVWDVEQEGHPC
jgi:hypothetical protein